MPRSSKPDRGDTPTEGEDLAACERQAVSLLARREHSRLELERKLASRAFPKGMIAETLDRLEQNGLLDGQRFMESFIESRAARGLGPVRIHAELAQRGIAANDAVAALKAAGQDWRAIARRVRAKRFGAERPVELKERARQARFLQYRGFDASQVDAALEAEDSGTGSGDPGD